MKLIQMIPEAVVRDLAAKAGPTSASAKVLVEADEITARGNKVRFWLTDEPGLCCEEGIEFFSTQSQ